MGKINPNLLIDHEWAGTFFPPERRDLGFAGKLTYSPTNGLHLEFARPMTTERRDLSWDYLLGETSSGEPFTLVGKFSTEKCARHISNGVCYWSSSNYPFHYVVFGHHIEDTTTFSNFEFNIAGAQEFFTPTGQKDWVPFCSTDIVSTQCTAGKISVFHSGTFDRVGSNLKGHFYAHDEALLNELQQAYTDIRNRNPKFQLLAKKQLDYLFRFVPSSELTIINASEVIATIADLFALLFFCPTRLMQIKAYTQDNKSPSSPMVVFLFTSNNEATIRLSQTKRNHYNLPLNIDDVDLGTLLAKWISESDRYQMVTSALQSETGMTSMHQIHGEIVLAVTQLENIANKARKNTKWEKFQYGIDSHASDNLRKALNELLSCPTEAIGERVSELRNDIAHVGRPGTLLKSLRILQLIEISRALQLVIIGYVLEQLGLSKQTRDKYQDSLIRR